MECEMFTAELIVTPRPGVRDPQAEAVTEALVQAWPSEAGPLLRWKLELPADTTAVIEVVHRGPELGERRARTGALPVEQEHRGAELRELARADEARPARGPGDGYDTPGHVAGVLLDDGLQVLGLDGVHARPP